MKFPVCDCYGNVLAYVGLPRRRCEWTQHLTLNPHFTALHVKGSIFGKSEWYNWDNIIYGKDVPATIENYTNLAGGNYAWDY